MRGLVLQPLLEHLLWVLCGMNQEEGNREERHGSLACLCFPLLWEHKSLLFPEESRNHMVGRKRGYI